MRSVYELSEAWSAYFAELEPKKRKELLDGLTDERAGMLSFARKLFQARHTDKKRSGREVDNWLYKFVYMPQMYQKQSFFRRSVRKDMEANLRELQLDGALTDEEQLVLYHEFRNVARRYLDTCRDAGYASSLMGMKRATKEQQTAKACEELWIISSGLPRQAGMEKEFALWKQALYDEVCAFDPDCPDLYDKWEKKA